MTKIGNGIFAAALGFALVVAPPVTAQDPGLVANLVSELGISEAQATGGMQAILGAAKGKLSPSDYGSLVDGAPALGTLAKGMVADAAGSTVESATEEVGSATAGMEQQVSALAGEAEGMAEEAVADVAAGVGDAVGSASGALEGLDLSSLSQLTGLTSQFEDLGLDAGMVQKFVPVALQYFGKDSGTSKLLAKGLGLL